jgi:Peptidase A4 family
MHSQNRQVLTRVVAVMATLIFIAGLSALAAAQAEDVAAIFAAAPKENTNIDGVRIFSGPPQGFNPLTATNRDLATYGLPQRPDKETDARGYRMWERGMLAAKTRASARLEEQPFSNSEITNREISNREMTSGRQTSVQGQALENAPVQYTSNNWSGVASFNTLKTWSKTTSFNYVTSVWNVPVSQPPFGACAAGVKGPFYVSIWNGIDGFTNGDVVQGGSLATAACNGKKNGTVKYYGWVEWYPSYPSLVIDCTGTTPCPVSPGDDFWVISYGVAGTADQSVFVEDLTQQWYGTFSLSWVSGPGVVGSSAEWIVERPCCVGANNYPLNNYVFDFFDFSSATNVKGTAFYPGATTTKTAIITMLDDSEKIEISVPTGVGSAGYQGRYSLWFEDENCALNDGCAP